jgi:hypothetical protein
MQSTDGLRAAVEAMSHEVALLGKPGLPGGMRNGDALRAAWIKVVDALALGPAAEYRTCTHCGTVGMRAATRCGHCWVKLPPLPAQEAGQTGAAT